MPDDFIWAGHSLGKDLDRFWPGAKVSVDDGLASQQEKEFPFYIFAHMAFCDERNASLLPTAYKYAIYSRGAMEGRESEDFFKYSYTKKSRTLRTQYRGKIQKKTQAIKSKQLFIITKQRTSSAPIHDLRI